MHIEHIAIWTRQLEKLRSFYETHFSAQAGRKYTNSKTGFQSYFLTFSGGARLELMQAADVGAPQAGTHPAGYAHIAFAVGSREEVDRLTRTLEAIGCRVAGAPRTTGDGYYESVVFDPDGNRVEITV